MQIYSAMPTSEFLQTLREAAIASKLGPIFIAKVDEVAEIENQAVRIEELEIEVECLKDEVRELQGELK